MEAYPEVIVVNPGFRNLETIILQVEKFIPSIEPTGNIFVLRGFPIEW